MPSYSRPRALTDTKKPRDQRTVYTRFVCYHSVDGQRYRLGLFQAIKHARHSDHSEAWALKLIEESGDWFDDNMEAPTSFNRALKDGQQLEICWFKPTAIDHIQNMYDLKNALEACGVYVDVLTTRDVGQILYEDDHQVAAIPNRHTF